jgi:hypothetical protein
MNPQETIKQKPGTAVGATGSLSLVVVWVAGNLFHWAISAEDGVVMATIISAVALFVAHNGLEGIWNLLRFGSRGDKGQTGGAQQQA